jgi:5-methylcytosine-specific restriction endonuclease McrA
MERKKPIKRTPIKRGTKPIAKRSKKTESAYVERRKLVERILLENPFCQACAVFAQHDGKSIYTQNQSHDVHELVRRSQGGSILEDENVIAVCRPCHTRIGNYPKLAFDLGLAKHAWDE